jgi:hypothetical protein
MIGEACEDIHFMQEPFGEGGKPSKYQFEFINEFFQEEFSGQDLMESHNSRARAPRLNVRAANAGLGVDRVKLDPRTEVKITGVLSATFSGFVHGAYIHLMELFGGPSFGFHTAHDRNALDSGMPGKPGESCISFPAACRRRRLSCHL